MSRRPDAKLPKRCECGGKMIYSFAFGRIFSCCDRCTPKVTINLPARRPGQ